MNENKLTDVHQALALAATDETKPKPMTTGTFRIEEESKRQAEELCNRHGTTLSAFLRACCHGLIVDYQLKDNPETVRVAPTE